MRTLRKEKEEKPTQFMESVRAGKKVEKLLRYDTETVDAELFPVFFFLFFFFLVNRGGPAYSGAILGKPITSLAHLL